MGLYTEETYREYGPQWKENLFYSHLLSLPLFLPFLPSLVRQFMRLAASPPLTLSLAKLVGYETLPQHVQSSLDVVRVPSQLAYLVVNVLTQYACIRGVNLLAAASTALTVTIVLNIRKLSQPAVQHLALRTPAGRGDADRGRGGLFCGWTVLVGPEEEVAGEATECQCG